MLVGQKTYAIEEKSIRLSPDSPGEKRNEASEISAEQRLQARRTGRLARSGQRGRRGLRSAVINHLSESVGLCQIITVISMFISQNM